MEPSLLGLVSDQGDDPRPADDVLRQFDAAVVVFAESRKKNSS